MKSIITAINVVIKNNSNLTLSYDDFQDVLPFQIV